MRVGALGICRLSFALALAGRIVSESRAGILLPGASGDKGSRSFASASTSWKLKTPLLNIRDREEGDSRDEKVVPPISPADDREIEDVMASAFWAAGEESSAARNAELNSVCALVGATGVFKSFSSASVVR